MIRQGSRKVLAYLLGVVAVVGLAVAEGLGVVVDAEAYWALVGSLAAYCGGNAAEHLASGRQLGETVAPVVAPVVERAIEGGE